MIEFLKKVFLFKKEKTLVKTLDEFLVSVKQENAVIVSIELVVKPEHGNIETVRRRGRGPITKSDYILKHVSTSRGRKIIYEENCFRGWGIDAGLLYPNNQIGEDGLKLYSLAKERAREIKSRIRAPEIKVNIISPQGMPMNDSLAPVKK